MVILKDFSVIWSLIHTLVMFLFLFESRYPKKKTMIITVSTMVPFIVINFILFIIIGIEKYGTLMLITLSLPICIVFWFLAKYRDGRFFFTFCMVDTTVLEIVYITNILNHYLTPDSFLLMFTVKLLIYPLIEIWTYKKLRPMFSDVQKHIKSGWGLFAVIGALFYVATTMLMTYPTTITERPEYIPVLVLLFLLMPIIYIHIITTLRYQHRTYKIEEKEKIVKLQVSTLSSRIDELAWADQKFCVERHNFRHKLKTIASLLQTEQYDECRTLLEEYSEKIKDPQIKRYCSNAIIDAVLSAYIQKTENKNIKVSYGFAFPDTISMNETELATAIANALENAINACEKLDTYKRFIDIKVLCRPRFMIKISNSYSGNINFYDNDIPISHKDEHGSEHAILLLYIARITVFINSKQTAKNSLCI